MEAFAKHQQRRLYVVTAPRSADEVFDFTRTALDRSYFGWLRAVEATEETSMSAAVVIKTKYSAHHSNGRPSQKPLLQLCQPVDVSLPRNVQAGNLPRKLTTQDYVEVMLATIREGGRQAPWPKDVVAQFLAADVVTSG